MKNHFNAPTKHCGYVVKWYLRSWTDTPFILSLICEMIVESSFQSLRKKEKKKMRLHKSIPGPYHQSLPNNLQVKVEPDSYWSKGFVVCLIKKKKTEKKQDSRTRTTKTPSNNHIQNHTSAPLLDFRPNSDIGRVRRLVGNGATKMSALRQNCTVLKRACDKQLHGCPQSGVCIDARSAEYQQTYTIHHSCRPESPLDGRNIFSELTFWYAACWSVFGHL